MAEYRCPECGRFYGAQVYCDHQDHPTDTLTEAYTAPAEGAEAEPEPAAPADASPA